MNLVQAWQNIGKNSVKIRISVDIQKVKYRWADRPLVSIMFLFNIVSKNMQYNVYSTK